MTNEELRNTLAEASKVFVLTDRHVAELWLTELKHWLGLADAPVLLVEPGESHKTLQTAQELWSSLLQQDADRHSVLVNLGGGVVTDLGGFVASCYQRGIRFVNVPTTLLAMVDAAIGGKNGVDFEGFKNQIGTFAQPLEVMVSPIFLSTLPDRELLSGLAEMLKYGYIADPSMLKVDKDNYEQYILRAGRLKREVVEDDFTEQRRRRVLNFGHSLGHALEAYSETTESPLTHGEAVALGMGCALRYSVNLCGLSETVFDDYLPKLRMLLSLADLAIEPHDADAVMSFLSHDKKRCGGQLQWVLLREPGTPVLDCAVPDDLVRQGLVEILDITRQFR